MINFSVIMSVYKNDNPIFLKRSLESITDLQTIKPTEIIIVIDGPVDSDIHDIINLYKQKYNFINTYEFEKNMGLGYAMQYAVLKSKNEIIARMDSDDVAVNNRFEQQIKFFKNIKIDIVGGDISEFDEDENKIISYRRVPTQDFDIKKYAKKRCPFNHMTVMFKKSSVLDAGNYQDWFYNEDYFLWIRMIKKNFIFANSGTILVNVRVGNQMLKRRGGYKYYKSEKKLQKYMLKNGIISYPVYFVNCIKRFIFECLISAKLRGKFYKFFARERR